MGFFYDYTILSWHFIQISGMNPKNCSLVCHCKQSQHLLIFLLCLCTISNIYSTSLRHFIVQSHSVLRLFLLQFFNRLTWFPQWNAFHSTDYSIFKALKNLLACRVSLPIFSCNKHLLFYCFLPSSCSLSLKIWFMVLNSSLLEI